MFNQIKKNNILIPINAKKNNYQTSKQKNN